MILKDSKEYSKTDRMGRDWFKRVIVLQCDECGIEFKRSGPNIQRTADRRFHFCSPECSHKSQDGGTLRKAIENTCIKKFGATSPLGSKECQAKSRATCLKKYGVEYVAASKEHIERRQETCIERYGAKSVLANDEVRQLAKIAMKEKYGVENSMKVPEINERRKRTMRQRYGVEQPCEIQEVKERAMLTRRKRYGCDWASQNKRIKKKTRKTKVENGEWIPLSQLTAFELYRRLAYAEMERQPLHMLDGFVENRGKHGLAIDHVYSVINGFKHDVPPEILSHISNLRVLTSGENSSKGSRSDKTLQQLHNDYFRRASFDWLVVRNAA